MALDRPRRPLGAARRRALPDDYYVAVMRDAMCVDTHRRTASTSAAATGRWWASPDAGETWAEIHKDLPDVCCVRAAVI